MMMTLVHALLQPNYSSNKINQCLNIINAKPYPYYDIGCDDLKTEIISFDDNSMKDIQEENIITQIDADVPNKQLSTTETLNNNIVAEDYKVSNKSRTKYISSLCVFSINKHKFNYKRKQINVHEITKRNEIKHSVFITSNKYLVHIVYNNYNNVFCNVIYKTNNNRFNNCLINMNIKHLKLFKLLNNLNTNYLYVYLYKKQLIIIDNWNKNIHINDNIYSKFGIIKHISFNMPNIEEVTEMYIKLPADLYNVLVLKAVDMTFNENGWQRLEQIFNILCNTMNGNLDGFDIVWWNMQTCWTSFRKNPNGKWTKEFTVNCEITPGDEEEIVTVYTIMIGKNVPINVEMNSIQVLLDLISKI